MSVSPHNLLRLIGTHSNILCTDDISRQLPLSEPCLPEPLEGSRRPYQVPEDCCFMMGDSRNFSLDARFWKNQFVVKDKIIAKVLFSCYPDIHKIE